MEKKLIELVDKALSRRSFLAGASTIAASTLIVGCDNSTPATTTPPPTTTAPPAASYMDSDYLNFALNLEYLEAEFYLRAATGTGLSAADSGTGAGVVTAQSTTKVPGLTNLQTSFVNELAQTELDHVRLLRSALGSLAVSRPAIDLTFFGALAQAAKITTDTSFTPFKDYPSFLIGGFTFEDVGVTAYHGAALKLTSKANLTVGAQIHAVEAYHAAGARAQIVAADFATGGGSTTYTDIANKVIALRSSLGSGNELMLSATSIVAADTTNSIGFKRSTDDVLHIVYGKTGVGVAAGGFFPAGVNGNIKVTTA